MWEAHLKHKDESKTLKQEYHENTNQKKAGEDKDLR